MEVKSDTSSNYGQVKSQKLGGSEPEFTPPFTKESPALAFKIVGRHKRARASTIYLPHGPVQAPVFMPVGTQGTMKGLTSTQMALPEIDAKIMLSNTYHLAFRPGTELLRDVGGLHSFMNWDRNILTDSGGFQMVSLLDFAEICEEGVIFQSPVDWSRMLLTPEMSIRHQNNIGSDIIMALDDVAPSTIEDSERFREACYRTIRWIDRCIAAHQFPERQNLFGIIQGGLDTSEGGLREYCLKEMVKRPLPGFAIGGLAGGESKEAFWKVVEQCCRLLPENKPRYLMGVGFPVDLVVCSALGVDMFDCVYPARTGRFGTAIVSSGLLKLKHSSCATDARPIDETCPCLVCKQYTRAYLHQLLKNENVACHLVSYHNTVHMLRLMKDVRNAIIENRFEKFVQDFMLTQFPEKNYPQWVVDALATADIPLVRDSTDTTTDSQP